MATGEIHIVHKPTVSAFAKHLDERYPWGRVVPGRDLVEMWRAHHPKVTALWKSAAAKLDDGISIPPKPRKMATKDLLNPDRPLNVRNLAHANAMDFGVKPYSLWDVLTMWRKLWWR